MALPKCPGCTKIIIPKFDDSCPNCGFKDVEKSLAAGQAAVVLPTKELPSNSTSVPEPEYGGFWIRLGAHLLDTIILMPVLFLQAWLLGRGREVYTYSLVPSFALSIFYHVYCVQRWGGTPGKLICGLRVVTTALEPAGWPHAWLRYSITLVIGVLSAIVQLYAIEQMSDREYASLSWIQRSRRIAELGGSAQTVLTWLTQIWVWSEFFVLLTNSRRRAIHDFIAGTVVIRK